MECSSHLNLLNYYRLKIPSVRVAAKNDVQINPSTFRPSLGIFLEEVAIFQQKYPSLDFFVSFFIKEKRMKEFQIKNAVLIFSLLLIFPFLFGIRDMLRNCIKAKGHKSLKNQVYFTVILFVIFNAFLGEIEQLFSCTSHELSILYPYYIYQVSMKHLRSISVPFLFGFFTFYFRANHQTYLRESVQKHLSVGHFPAVGRSFLKKDMNR